jgi:putative solute:sodium symporter small subunit
VTEGAPPDRVRVTGPPRRRPPAGRTSDIDAGTRLGGVYMRSLLREQLRLALGVLTVLMLTIGLLPLAFYLAPSLSDVRLLGMPLGWLLLGVVVYPVLVALGWVYVRRAERNERDFAEILSEARE